MSKTKAIIYTLLAAAFYAINFMKEVKFVNKANEKKGEFNLAKPLLGGRAAVYVWLCRDCRKIVIDL
jgi:hypothetical protein